MVDSARSFAFDALANAIVEQDGMTPWQSAMKRGHRKGISEKITYSPFHDDDGDESGKLDTWVGFYNPRKSARRSLGP